MGFNVYIFICLCHLSDQVCAVYIVKEIASFWGLWQLMGMAYKRTLCLSYRPAGRLRKNVRLLITVVYSRETVRILLSKYN